MQVTPDGKFSETGKYSIARVAGAASPVRTVFLNPESLWEHDWVVIIPSNAKQERLTVVSSHTKTPFTVRESDPISSVSGIIIEEIRVIEDVRMGLAMDIAAASRMRGMPKIAMLRSATAQSDGMEGADIQVLLFSLGERILMSIWMARRPTSRILDGLLGDPTSK
ncbi:hypothetical protein EYZ11_001748 [Aspergillus tanneri]|nr:hypothetical protein EYZ11_001748 [Aspergillus tanneri]